MSNPENSRLVIVETEGGDRQLMFATERPPTNEDCDAFRTGIDCILNLRPVTYADIEFRRREIFEKIINKE